MKTTVSGKKDKALKSKWVWAILALFATIFVVNYGFISVALKTSPGLVTEEYYKHGLQQNKIDKQYRTQAARGWQVKLVMDKKWPVNQSSTIQLVITDKYSQPISGGHAEVTAYRPSDAKADIIKELVETAKPGIYQTEITLPMQGTWDMNLLFSKNDDKHMLNQRIIVLGDGDVEPSTLEKIVDRIAP